MVDALNEAIHKFGPPEIMNTDQGSQFTSFVWTDRLRRSSVRISMDGKGRFLPSRDHAAHNPAGQRINIFIEWLWRLLKYECVYLHACMGNRIRCQGRRQEVDQVLQSQTPIFRSWRQTTRCDLLAAK